MDVARSPIIEDVQTLRAMVLQLMVERDQSIAERDAAIATVTQREAAIAALQEQIARMNRWRFSRRAEALDPAQRALFDEHLAEDTAALGQLLESLPKVQEPSKPSTTTPRSSPRRPLPAHLARIEERHDLPTCTCTTCGQILTKMGEDVHEQLDCEPIQFFVRRQVYPKYACRTCDTVTAAPVPAQVIARSDATPGLLAHVLVSKYADHLPLYRQAQIAARHGVELARSTLADWVGRCGVALDPLVRAMREDLHHDTVLHADETPITYLDPSSGKSQRAYLFAYRTGTAAQPIVVFDFCDSRSGEHARRFLGTWRGTLMVDDYGGYKALFAHGINELACWAHARRKFYELHATGKSAHAQQALHFIAQLYHSEAQVKGLDPPARHAWRQHHSVPILHAFKTWLDTTRLKVANGTGLAKAMDYTLRRWPALARCLEQGDYPIDNNAIENAIRPIALGRKNWLFAGSLSAGQRAAHIMSLIATVKANGKDPHAYLKDVLTRLPTTLDRNIATLLPHRWTPTTSA